MLTEIPTPTVGEILKDEFLDPLGLDAIKLARALNVPAARIVAILRGQRRLTVETGLKLSRYFNMSDRFFIDLQTEIDVRHEKPALVEELAGIAPLALA
ncbi:MAG: HigA family addiction module antidote protein [Planctomycetota bacterium]|jgi:addiction module HigA family antidote|nr:HigA family addiction module antidote protein [Planctomycetota bacterium]